MIKNPVQIDAKVTSEVALQRLSNAALLKARLAYFTPCPRYSTTGEDTIKGLHKMIVSCAPSDVGSLLESTLLDKQEGPRLKAVEGKFAEMCSRRYL